jgi:hypothetical protein
MIPEGIALCVSCEDKKMYWAERILDKIMSANVDGSSIDIFAENQEGNNPTIEKPGALAVDEYAKTVYWTNDGREGGKHYGTHHKVQKRDVDGGSIETLSQSTGSGTISHLTALSLAPEPELPDLAVEVTTFPVVLYYGTVEVIKVKVTNVGGPLVATTDPLKYNVTKNAIGTFAIDWPATYEGSFNLSVTGLPAGDSKEKFFWPYFPGSVSNGVYTPWQGTVEFCIEVDPDGIFAESDSSNNGGCQVVQK